jgi:hypothetical protein
LRHAFEHGDGVAVVESWPGRLSITLGSSGVLGPLFDDLQIIRRATHNRFQFGLVVSPSSSPAAFLGTKGERAEYEKRPRIAGKELP